MATLLAVMNGKHAVACCNAKCYDAKTSRCKCICGGANHGKGYVEAAAATELSWRSWWAGWVQEHLDVPARGCFVNGDYVRKGERLLV